MTAPGSGMAAPGVAVAVPLLLLGAAAAAVGCGYKVGPVMDGGERDRGSEETEGSWGNRKRSGGRSSAGLEEETGPGEWEGKVPGMGWE